MLFDSQQAFQSQLRAASPNLYLFIDHDNIDYQSFPLRNLISGWINALSQYVDSGNILTAQVRAFGGWYSGYSTSEQRFTAAQFYQAQLPTFLKVGEHRCRISFKFADQLSLMNDHSPPFRITHTVVNRSKPLTIGIKKPPVVCAHPECKLKEMKKWLKKARACYQDSCPHSFSEAFDRLEQKQVDVHIALDLVFLANTIGDYQHLALASDDLDILPALVAAKRIASSKRATISLIRCNEPNSYVIETLSNESILFIRLK